MEGSLLTQGLDLMVLGMGTVFAFLTLLVFATRGMSAVAVRLTPAEDLSAMPRSATPHSADNEEEIVAAIAAAITEHRS